MKEDFDAAVKKIMDYLGKYQYSAGIISTHRSCYRQLWRICEENKINYSDEVGQDWLRVRQERVCFSTVKTYKQVLKRLDLALQGFEVPDLKKKSARWMKGQLSPYFIYSVETGWIC